MPTVSCQNKFGERLGSGASKILSLDDDQPVQDAIALS
jgi:hypothetical protein